MIPGKYLTENSFGKSASIWGCCLTCILWVHYADEWILKIQLKSGTLASQGVWFEDLWDWKKHYQQPLTVEKLVIDTFLSWLQSTPKVCLSFPLTCTIVFQTPCISWRSLKFITTKATKNLKEFAVKCVYLPPFKSLIMPQTGPLCFVFEFYPKID